MTMPCHNVKEWTVGLQAMDLARDMESTSLGDPTLSETITGWEGVLQEL